MQHTTHIKGVVLEEVVLYLLRIAGYRTVETVGCDPTLGTCAAGLQVKGRGGEHQIDAIADFAVGQPFSHAQRLLVEAKCYGHHRPVGLSIVRNAVGVLKDVSEFWHSPRGGPLQKSRYHYQFALFSTSAFTKEAQRYAFAHDIHLLPLESSAFFRPILREIYTVVGKIHPQVYTGRAFQIVGSSARPRIAVSDLRAAVRATLQPQRFSQYPPEYLRLEEELRPLAELCHRSGGAVIAMIAGSFPLFLVAEPELDVNALSDVERVRITRDSQGWYLVSARREDPLFSFDIPTELFEMYAEAGTLHPMRALDLKEDLFSEIQALVVSEGRVRVLHFQLDREWLDGVRAEARQTPQPREEDLREF